MNYDIINAPIASGSFHEEMLADALPVSLYASLPFALFLLSLAMIPALYKEWWDRDKNKLKITIPFILIVLTYLIYSFGMSGIEKIEHGLLEYIQFIILLATFYILSGGVAIDIKFNPSPKNNSLLLLSGACLASLVGTMGASAILIRPIIALNSQRKRISHTIIFFILIVSNAGGVLTPMGDPPLFMGFLKGVPFLWTLNLWKAWLTATILLTLTYYVVDSFFHKKENIIIQNNEKVNFRGGINIFLICLSVIIACLAPLLGANESGEPSNGSPLREICFIIIIFISLKATPKEIYQSNKFTFAPIREIGIIFIGLFITMIPAFEWLLVNGTKLGIDSPVKYFWATGLLSGFLDNTPTYLMFFCVGKCEGVPIELIGSEVAKTGIQEIILKAISVGAVFMGGLTYLGNGPNLMVKDIAEENGVNMPSFFKFTCISFLILLPLLLIISSMLAYGLL